MRHAAAVSFVVTLLVAGCGGRLPLPGQRDHVDEADVRTGGAGGLGTGDAGAVAGLVIDSEMRPVASAEVRLSPSPVPPTTSDASGRFGWAHVVGGTYTLSVHRDGFVDADRSITVGDGRGRIVVVLGQRPAPGPFYTTDARTFSIDCATGYGVWGTMGSCGGSGPVSIEKFPLGGGRVNDWRLNRERNVLSAFILEGQWTNGAAPAPMRARWQGYANLYPGDAIYSPGYVHGSSGAGFFDPPMRYFVDPVPFLGFWHVCGGTGQSACESMRVEPMRLTVDLWFGGWKGPNAPGIGASYPGAAVGIRADLAVTQFFVALPSNADAWTFFSESWVRGWT